MTSRAVGAVLFGVAALALPARPAAAGSRYVVGPPGGWVDVAPVPDPAAIPAETVGSGVFFLLVDEQIRVGPERPEAYHHFAQRVLSTSGVQDASELSIEFDPEYERLTLHHVTLWREGRRIDALRHAEVNVIQQEGELEKRLYNGTFTALLFLHDRVFVSRALGPAERG